MLQPEEENPFENNASQTAQCKHPGKQFQMLRKEGSEGQDSWKEKNGCKKGEGDPPIFAGIDSFQGHPGRFAQVI